METFRAQVGDAYADIQVASRRSSRGFVMEAPASELERDGSPGRALGKSSPGRVRELSRGAVRRSVDGEWPAAPSSLGRHCDRLTREMALQDPLAVKMPPGGRSGNGAEAPSLAQSSSLGRRFDHTTKELAMQEPLVLNLGGGASAGASGSAADASPALRPPRLGCPPPSNEPAVAAAPALSPAPHRGGCSGGSAGSSMGQLVARQPQAEPAAALMRSSSEVHGGGGPSSPLAPASSSFGGGGGPGRLAFGGAIADPGVPGRSASAQEDAVSFAPQPRPAEPTQLPSSNVEALRVESAASHALPQRRSCHEVGPHRETLGQGGSSLHHNGIMDSALRSATEPRAELLGGVPSYNIASREGSPDEKRIHSEHSGSRTELRTEQMVSSAGYGTGARPSSPLPNRSSPLKTSACSCQDLDTCGADKRQASFLRLNAFLLRSHAKSLVAALEMDGWLDRSEGTRLKEKLSSEASDSAKAFMTAYTHFMATEDVQDFANRLRMAL